jgi:hypothetical protein
MDKIIQSKDEDFQTEFKKEQNPTIYRTFKDTN